MLSTASLENQPQRVSSCSRTMEREERRVPLRQVEVPLSSTQEPGDVRISISTEIQESSDPENGLIEQCCYLRKICGLLLSLMAWTILALDEQESPKRLENLHEISFYCLAYMTCEDIFLSVKVAKEKAFEVLDGVLMLCFLIVTKFWDERNHSKYHLLASLCIFLLLGSVCLRLIMAPSTTRGFNGNFKTLKRFGYIIQILLVNAKTLKYIYLSWTGVFVPSGFWLLGLQVSGLILLMKSSRLFLRQINSDGFNSLSFITGLLKISWLILYHGLGYLVFGILILFCQQAESGHNEELMSKLLVITKYYCSFLFGYTLVFLRFVREFNVNFNENDSQEKPAALLKGYLKANKELLTSYFVRVSSTYFLKISEEDKRLLLEESREIDLEEEDLCYICDINKPDIILMDCGHGGVCKDCTLLSLKKKKNCMECRRPIQEIYEIKQSSNDDTGVIKACKIFDIVY